MFKNLALAGLGLSLGESESIELALSHGFKGLNPNLSEFAQQVKTHGMDRAARRLISSRLKMGSFPIELDWEVDDAKFEEEVKKLAPLADLAAQLGCSRAVMDLEPASDHRPYHQNFELHRRRLAALAEALAAHKIRLGVGFLAPKACRGDRAYQFVQTADELVLLLRSVSTTNIGIVLDSFHWHLGGGTAERLGTLAPQGVIAVTLSDVEPTASKENAQLAMRRLPGAGGGIDNAALLAALTELRYDGPVSPAADTSQHAAQGREQIVKAAAAALDTIWKVAVKPQSTPSRR